MGRLKSGTDTSTPTDFIQAVERVFAVICAFNQERPALTLSEVAERADLNRATARRFLITLQHLGYVRSEKSHFHLRPKILEVGHAYLATMPVWDVIKTHMEALARQTDESSSCSVLEGTDITFTVRVPSTRLMRLHIEVGTRLHAYATSMGRVLLASLEDSDLENYFSIAEFEQLTERTLTSEKELRKELANIREQGWCLIDQELELGLRSIAVPLCDANRNVFSALNIAAVAARVSQERLLTEYLPLLQKTARDIEEDMHTMRISEQPVLFRL